MNVTLDESNFSNISLLIPCRNEMGTIATALECSTKLPGVFEILVIEGNSTDDTFDYVKNFLESFKSKIPIYLLKQPGKGKWDAVNAGINGASCEYISIWDADLTVSPTEQILLHKKFITLLQEFGETPIFITGDRLKNREKGSMRFFNVIGNYAFKYLWKFGVDKRFSDSLCGSKIFKKSILNHVPDNFKLKDPYGDFTILAASKLTNCIIYSIAIPYRPRSYGQTNIARWSGGLALLVIWFRYFKLIRDKL